MTKATTSVRVARRPKLAADAQKAASTPEPEAVVAQPEEALALDKLIGHFNGLRTMVIDPTAAHRLLETNTANRRVSLRRVSQLADQMREGGFENTGEPIIISDEGILNNGQHRLLAVIESGASVEMDLRFGIPRRAFVKTDTGAARSGADVLSIRGVQGASQIATTLRMLIAYERGLPEHIRDFISNDDISKAWDRWPDVEGAVAKVQVYRFPSQIRSTPLFATIFLAMRAPKAAGLDSWLHMLATGLEANRENPAYQLRERLIKGVGNELGTRERQLQRFALMIKSWNLFRNDETVSMRDFRWSQTGRDAEPFPRVSGARL